MRVSTSHGVRLTLEVRRTGEVFFQGKAVHTLRATRGYSEVRIPLHRLVAEVFHGPPPSKKHVCHHIDCNPRNNSADNLKWMTQKDNLNQRSYAHLRKLTPEQEEEIRRQAPGQYETLVQMARRFGVSTATIRAVRSGRTWKNGWHAHNRRLLTPEMVEEIKAWSKPRITAPMLARKYKISDGTILNIWKSK